MWQAKKKNKCLQQHDAKCCLLLAQECGNIACKHRFAVESPMREALVLDRHVAETSPNEQKFGYKKSNKRDGLSDRKNSV